MYYFVVAFIYFLQQILEKMLFSVFNFFMFFTFVHFSLKFQTLLVVSNNIHDHQLQISFTISLLFFKLCINMIFPFLFYFLLNFIFSFIYNSPFLRETLKNDGQNLIQIPYTSINSYEVWILKLNFLNS